VEAVLFLQASYGRQDDEAATGGGRGNAESSPVQPAEKRPDAVEERERVSDDMGVMLETLDKNLEAIEG